MDRRGGGDGGSGGGDGGGGGFFRPRSNDYYSGGNSHKTSSSSSASASGGCLNLHIGNHLRTVHPTPIRSDQVIFVPSMFGSELNMTTFADVREELEPILRAKYNNTCDDNKNRKKDWSLDSVRDNTILTANISRGGMGGAVVTPPTEKVVAMETDGNADDGVNHDDILEEGHEEDGCRSSSSRDSADAAMMHVARRVCQYFSIDPDMARVNVGIRLGLPYFKALPAHSSNHKSGNCFVVVTLGSPRTLVLCREDHSPRLCVSLTNNSVTAIMLDVTQQGWLYGIENLAPDELNSVGRSGAAATNQRPETITFFINGPCTTMVPPARRLPMLPPHPKMAAHENHYCRRVSVGSDAGAGNTARRDTGTSDDTSWNDSRDGAGRHRDRPYQSRRSSTSKNRQDLEEDNWHDAVETFSHHQGRPRRDDEDDCSGPSSGSTCHSHLHHEYRRSRSRSRSPSVNHHQNQYDHYRRRRSDSPH